MDASYISAFIEATRSIFTTMIRQEVTFGAPMKLEHVTSKSDISGIIGLSGDVTGAVILSFPAATAEQVVSAFCGSPMTIGSDDFADAIGELANMLSGGAKAKFNGKNVSISCPSVVTGSGHKVQQPSDSVCILIPCSTMGKDFSVEVCIINSVSNSAQSAEKTATATK